MRVERYGYVPTPVAPGKFRGGLSTEREYRSSQDAVLTVRADRERSCRTGSRAERRDAVGQRARIPIREPRTMPPSSAAVKAGDRFRHLTAGAGGWGDPLERDPSDVARDVRNGMLSAEYARREYGVVLTDATSTVDETATDGATRTRAAP